MKGFVVIVVFFLLSCTSNGPSPKQYMVRSMNTGKMYNVLRIEDLKVGDTTSMSDGWDQVPVVVVAILK